jgi:DNA invertase Pin-like site-specific DNA recombinase
MLDDLKRQGVKFRSLTEAIDTETPTDRAMWQMIGVLPHARKLINAGEHSREEITALFKVGRKTLYRALAAA